VVGTLGYEFATSASVGVGGEKISTGSGHSGRRTSGIFLADAPKLRSSVLRDKLCVKP